MQVVQDTNLTQGQTHVSQPLRCLFVGMGFIGTHMHKFLSTKPWYVPAAAVDVRDTALSAAQTALSLPDNALYKNLDEALDRSGANVAFINTPSELHFSQAKAALNAGLHVLIAKPITNSYEQAVELVQLAGQKGVTVSVGQQIRYNRHYQALTRFVEAGQLGSIEAAWFMNSKPRPNPVNLARFEQPTLYENACHHFDTFLGVFGDPRPDWIVCDGFIPSWSPYIGPCMVNALIQFTPTTPGGKPLHMSYHGGFSSRAPMYEFRLEGSDGALNCHGLHLSNDIMRYEIAPALGNFAPAAVDEGIPAQNPFLPFFDVWHDYVAGGKEPPFSGRNNLKTFAMLTAAIESTQTGQRVEIAGNPRFAGAFA